MGLCESLNLGHRVVSSCRHRHHAVSWRGSGTGGGGVGPRRVLQPSGRGRGEAELPLGSFGQGKGPVPTLGQEPRWRQEHMLTVFRAPAWGCLTEAPGGKGWKQRGPGPTGTVQHTFLQNQLLSFSLLSLEASITCNSLELIYIKTIKYDLRYKLTSTRPHIT